MSSSGPYIERRRLCWYSLAVLHRTGCATFTAFHLRWFFWVESIFKTETPKLRASSNHCPHTYRFTFKCYREDHSKVKKKPTAGNSTLWRLINQTARHEADGQEWNRKWRTGHGRSKRNRNLSSVQDGDTVLWSSSTNLCTTTTHAWFCVWGVRTCRCKVVLMLSRKQKERERERVSPETEVLLTDVWLNSNIF